MFKLIPRWTSFHIYVYSELLSGYNKCFYIAVVASGYHNKLPNYSRPRARQNCPNFYNSFTKYVSLFQLNAASIYFLFGTWGSIKILLYLLYLSGHFLPRCFDGEFLWRPRQHAGLFGQMPPHSVETSMSHCEQSLSCCGWSWEDERIWWWWWQCGTKPRQCYIVSHHDDHYYVASWSWFMRILDFRESQFCRKNCRDCFRKRLTERNVKKTKRRGQVLAVGEGKQIR